MTHKDGKPHKKVTREELSRRREEIRRTRRLLRERRRHPKPKRTRENLKTIHLNGPKKETISSPKAKADSRGFGAKALDILSSTLLEPTTFITKGPAAAGRKVAERRARLRRTKSLSEAVGTASEALTATALIGGGILGTATAGGRAVASRLIPKLIPKTPRGILATTTAAGILITSPTARRFAGRFVEDPTRLGRGTGEIIEKASKGEDVGGIKEALKKAGLIGAGIAGTGLLIAGAKKLLSRDKRPPQLPTTQFQPISNLGTTPLIVTGGAPSSTGDVTPVISPTKATKEEGVTLPPPSVTVNNNIRINNRSSANRRFINTIHV